MTDKIIELFDLLPGKDATYVIVIAVIFFTGLFWRVSYMEDRLRTLEHVSSDNTNKYHKLEVLQERLSSLTVSQERTNVKLDDVQEDIKTLLRNGKTNHN